jgi:hypothetical protein
MSVLILRSSAVGGGSGLYPWDGSGPYEYWRAARADDDPGSGTIGSPYNLAQVMQLSPGIGRKVIKAVEGGVANAKNVTGEAADQKHPYYTPVNDCSAGNEIIIQGYSTSSTAAAGDRTYIQRSSGAGTPMGCRNVDGWYWDGIWNTTSANPNGASTAELSLVGFWGASRCGLVRSYLDSEEEVYAPSNYACIHIEACDNIEVGDTRWGGIDQRDGASTGFSNNVGMLIYDASYLNVHHSLAELCPAGIWEKGQHNADTVHHNRYHHNRYLDCGIGAYSSSPIQTTIDAASWYYQSIAQRCQYGFGMKSFAGPSEVEPRGIMLVNLLVVKGQSWQSADPTGPIGFFYQDSGSATGELASPLYVYNCIARGVAYAHLTFGNSWEPEHDDIEVDYNHYYGNSGSEGGIYQEGAGEPARSLATWQGAGYGNDANVLTSDPQMVDYANDDFRPSSTSSPDYDSGSDVLSLAGGGSINRGPYILPGFTDQIGRRN